jgi:hypothetical protein
MVMPFAAVLWAQAQPTANLEIDVDNAVIYWEDVADSSKWATMPGPVARDATAGTALRSRTAIGDIVAVNGQPAKGLWALVFRNFTATTSLTPGRVIADLAGGCVVEGRFVLLNQDGTVIGSIVTGGNNSGGPAPGAPVVSGLSTLQAVIGGTGVYMGARGQASMSGSPRAASIAEDPAYRRANGGQKVKHYIQLVPISRPEVLSAGGGLAAFRATDWSPITQANPARAGEQVIICVSGLGPVRPNYDLSKPFPPDGEALLAVNSPVGITVNGKSVRVINSVGWPGLRDVYRVDVVMPAEMPPGVATVGVNVAWINGPEFSIPVH